MKKKNKVISYLPSESSYGLPSSVFHAVLMRVACRNPVLLVLLRVQYLVSKQSRLCASKNWTRVSVGERKVPLRFKKVT